MHKIVYILLDAELAKRIKINNLNNAQHQKSLPEETGSPPIQNITSSQKVRPYRTYKLPQLRKSKTGSTYQPLKISQLTSQPLPLRLVLFSSPFQCETSKTQTKDIRCDDDAKFRKEGCHEELG